MTTHDINLSLTATNELSPAAERKLSEFESAWGRIGNSSKVPAIESFLDEKDQAGEPGLLEEMVRVDMELRASRSLTFSVEDYLRRFPILNSVPGALQRIEIERQRLTAPQSKASVAKTKSFPDVPGQFLGFELIGILGEGAFGRVYLARQDDLARRLVVLKITTNRTHEAQRLAQLQHTNIVPIYSQHESGDWRAICMPFLGESTFADLIPNRKEEMRSDHSGRELISTLARRKSATIPMLVPSLPDQEPDGDQVADKPGSASEPERDSYLRETVQPRVPFEALKNRKRDETYAWLWQQVAQGLAFAHEQGIIHGDVKPANILISDRGYPKLLDFNLAIRRSENQAHQVGGTVPYASAEHLQAIRTGSRIGEKTDLFSLGVVFYQLLTGRLPFSTYAGSFEENVSRMVEDRQKGAASILETLPDLDPNLASIVDKSIEGNPEKQYRTASELIEDLQRFLEHRPLRHAANRSIRQRMKNWMIRHPILASTSSIAAISILVLGSIGLMSWSIWQKNVRMQIAEDTREWVERVKKTRRPLSSDASPAEMESQIDKLEKLIQSHPQEVLFSGQELTSRLSNEQKFSAEQELIAGHLSVTDALLRTGFKGWSKEPAALTDRIKSHHQWVQEHFPQRAETAGFKLQQSRLAELSGDSKKAAELREQGKTVAAIDNLDRKLLASQWLSVGEARLAGALLEQAVEFDGTDFEAWLLLGNAWFQQNRLHESEACFTVCQSLEPASEFAAYSRARIRYQQGNLEGAHDDYSRAIELDESSSDGRDPAYFSDRALVEMAMEQWGKARQDLTMALELPGVELRARYLRHLANTALGLEKEAAEDLKIFLNSKPHDDDGWAFRAGAFLKQGDVAQALSDIEEAIKINSRSLTAWQNKAAILAQDPKKTAESIEAMTKLIELEPGNPTHIATRGVLLARAGKREQAHRDAEKAIQIDPSADTRYRVAGIYAQTSKIDKKDLDSGILFMALAIMEQPQVVLNYIDSDPDIEPLKQDPRFKKLVDSLLAIQSQAESR